MKQSIPTFCNPFGESAIAGWDSIEFIAALFPTAYGLKLSIGRRDGEITPMSWEELMQVKRACGFGELDAVEVYPKDIDIFNTGNLRHLFFIGELPFAFRKNTGVLQNSNAPDITTPVGA